jgi:flavodoxin
VKTLLVYYSLDGNTDFVAQTIAKETGADTVRLHQVKEPPEGLGKYLIGGYEALSRHDVEIYSYRDLNPQDYDTIILGTPVWAGTYAPALRTYLNQHPFENKGVYLFAISMSGKARGALERLTKHLKTGHNDVLGAISFKNPLIYSNRSQVRARKFADKICSHE